MKHLLYMSLLLSAYTSLSFTHTKDHTIQHLWDATATWDREYLVDVSGAIPNLPEVKRKLLSQRSELAEAFKSYYGEKSAQELRTLFQQDGTLTMDLINAITSKDQTKMVELESRWKQNASDISAFLSKLNPYVNFRTMRDMLYDYGAHLGTMSRNRVQKKWTEDISTYEKVISLNKKIAKILAQAITNAFPQGKKNLKPITAPTYTGLPAGTTIRRKAASKYLAEPYQNT